MTAFQVGDIVLYDSRASYGPTIELTGIVTSKIPTVYQDKEEWKYQIRWYKSGEFYNFFEIEERIARTMKFIIVGNIYPFAHGMPNLSAYADLDRRSNDGRDDVQQA